jgi:hypothetical protein
MRRALSVSLVLAAAVPAAAPAAAADRCAHSGDGAHFTARAVERSVGSRRVRSRAVVCDRRTGRERTLARAWYRTVTDADRSLRGRGRWIQEAAAGGRWAAWVEARTGGRGMTTAVTLADLRTGRVVWRRRVARTARFDFRSFSEYALDVAVSARADVGWIDHAGTVGVRQVGRGLRAVGRAVHAAYLDFEDDRTLRWFDGDGAVYVDLRGAPTPGRCPRRSRFRPLLTTPDVVVTRALYEPVWDSDEDYVEVVRGCHRASGRDPVIRQTEGGAPYGGEAIEILAARAEWVAMVTYGSWKWGCPGFQLSTVSARDATVVREAFGGCTERDVPMSREDAVAVLITDAGAPVWQMRMDAAEERLYTAPVVRQIRGASPVELDRAPPGAIANLRVAGEAAHWTNAGRPRSVTP